MPRALLLASLLVLGCSEPPPEAVAESAAESAQSAPSDLQARLAIIDTAPPHDVLRYFSGNFPNLMNHPAIWWTRGEPELVVSGRGTLERFEVARIDDALAAYRALLISCRYEPQGAPPREPPPGGMVAMRMDELFPSEAEAARAFTSQQFEAIRNVSSLPLYAHLAGHDGSAHDRVIMYASSLGLAVVSKTANETIPMAESSRAFAALRGAVAPAP